MNKKLEQAATMALGAVLVLGGSELGLTLLEGRLASIPHLAGATVLMLVFYCMLPRSDK